MNNEKKKFNPLKSIPLCLCFLMFVASFTLFAVSLALSLVDINLEFYLPDNYTDEDESTKYLTVTQKIFYLDEYQEEYEYAEIGKELNIPSQVRYNGQLFPVKAIGSFPSCSNLTTITIPASVIDIEEGAFSGAELVSAVFEETSGWCDANGEQVWGLIIQQRQQKF